MPELHRDRFHFFNTFFYEKLEKRQEAYNKIQKWTNKVDIFSKDFLIIPINENSHWSLVIVCYPGLVPATHSEKDKDPANKKMPKKNGEPCIIYLDSLSGKKKSIHKIRDYLKREWQARKALQGEKVENFLDDKLPYYQPDVPNQANYYDCGLFLLHYIEKFAATPDVSIRFDYFFIKIL